MLGQNRMFVSLGYPRCGTTFFYKQLDATGKFNLSLGKETDFFYRSDHYTYSDLSEFFGSKYNIDLPFVDFSVNYCLSKDIVRCLAGQNSLKMFFFCRKPSELLNSLYSFAQRRGLGFNTFYDFLETDVGLVMGPNPGIESPYPKVLIRDFIDVVHYHDFLARVIPERRFLTIPLELVSDEMFIVKINEFFEVNMSFIAKEERVNVANTTRFSVLSRFIPTVSRLLRRWKFNYVLDFLKGSKFVRSLLFKDSECKSNFLEFSKYETFLSNGVTTSLEMLDRKYEAQFLTCNVTVCGGDNNV